MEYRGSVRHLDSRMKDPFPKRHTEDFRKILFCLSNQRTNMNNGMLEMIVLRATHYTQGSRIIELHLFLPVDLAIL